VATSGRAYEKVLGATLHAVERRSGIGERISRLYKKTRNVVKD